MAYKTADLEKQALAAIKKHNIVFVEDIVSYLACSKPTFYEHKLNESDSIKDAVQINKTNIKQGLRKKWNEGDNATTQIALYKLVSTDAELSKLNRQEIKQDTNLSINWQEEKTYNET